LALVHSFIANPARPDSQYQVSNSGESHTYDARARDITDNYCETVLIDGVVKAYSMYDNEILPD
jgi:hypothetical protein